MSRVDMSLYEIWDMRLEKSRVEFLYWSQRESKVLTPNETDEWQVSGVLLSSDCLSCTFNHYLLRRKKYVCGDATERVFCLSFFFLSMFTFLFSLFCTAWVSVSIVSNLLPLSGFFVIRGWLPLTLWHSHLVQQSSSWMEEISAVKEADQN